MRRLGLRRGRYLPATRRRRKRFKTKALPGARRKKHDIATQNTTNLLI
jgi:hypothetical protein